MTPTAFPTGTAGETRRFLDPTGRAFQGVWQNGSWVDGAGLPIQPEHAQVQP